jgi:shikimate kinase
MTSRHLVLIGYRGTGKSTVAGELAAALGRPWVDADLELTHRAGQSIREIFDQQGEQAFRDLEAEVLADLLSRAPSVIATGGGVVLRPENRQRLAASGFAVWLRASAETITARLEADATTAAMRPELIPGGQAAEVVEMLRLREPLYSEAAQATVHTDDKSPAEIAAEILSQLERHAARGQSNDRGELA